MKTFEEIAVEIADDIVTAVDEIEIDMCEASVYKLSDAIREGSDHTKQAYNWGQGENMCALTAAYVSAHARKYC